MSDERRVAYVSYTVPVMVEVDLDEKLVKRVVIIDEELVLDRKGGVWQTRAGALEPAADDVAWEATAVAEDPEAVWPRW